MDIQTSIALIGVVGTLCSIIFGFIGYKTGVKKEAKQDGVMLSDMGYIKAGVDDIKREQKDMANNFNHLSERVTRCEESCKQAHHRIDEVAK